MVKEESVLKALRFLVAVVCVSVFFSAFAGAEPRLDAYFGLGTAYDGSTHQVLGSPTSELIESPSLDGIFGTFGGAVFFKPTFGVGAQVSLRFRQGDYSGYGYRPIFYDFNGIWTPVVGKRIMPEFQAGFGGVNMRFYDATSPYYDYNTGTYSTFAGSSNHLQLHAAAGLRIFVKEHIFIRPQVDYHWVRNLNEFAGSSVPAYSIAIGFTTGNRR
jgi:hypothetical protein